MDYCVLHAAITSHVARIQSIAVQILSADLYKPHYYYSDTEYMCGCMSNWISCQDSFCRVIIWEHQLADAKIRLEWREREHVKLWLSSRGFINSGKMNFQSKILSAKQIW